LPAKRPVDAGAGKQFQSRRRAISVATLYSLLLRLKQNVRWVRSAAAQFMAQARAFGAQRVNLVAMIQLGVEVEFLVHFFASFHDALSGSRIPCRDN
jgi:hypothetical protein